MVTSSLIAFVVLMGVRMMLMRAPGPVRGFLAAGPWGDALAYFLQIQYYRNHSGSEPDARCLFRGNTLHTPSWYHRFALHLCSDATLWAKPWLPNLALYAAGAAATLLLAATAGSSRRPWQARLCSR